MIRFYVLRFFACIVIGFLLLFSGCASDSTSLVGQTYNNVTAHYNGYWYSLQEVAKIEQTIYKSQTDDYNRILKLFPPLDSVTAKGYDKEAQECVKMASLAIQRHPKSRWVDDAYILVGKARLYSLDWGNAIQTFKYVNTKSKDKAVKHSAIIYLIRTFVEHKEFNNARAAIDFLQKEKLNKINKKNFYLEKAYYFQTLEDYDNMVRSLTAIDDLLKRKDRRGRIYFIIGQVYQKLGFESEAYSYYKKCLSTNPEYEVDFYARLYMAQVTEITRNKDVNAARKSFKKLLKDGKNKEFKDKIYYEMGVFELKQKNINVAVADFKEAVRKGKSKSIDGEAFLRLGEVYYDTLKNYELSQAYYDSAINSLPKDFEGYAKIKERADILDEFVKNLKTIQWQDSLLSMARLDSASLRSLIDSSLTARKNLEEKNAGKKKKRKSNRIDIQSNSNNNAFANNDDDENQNVDNPDAGDWYFGNSSAMSIGQTEFERTWGQVVLEDNWRRSLRSSASSNPNGIAVDENNNAPAKTEEVKEEVKADPVDVAYMAIVKQLPLTDEQKKQSLAKIEDAYFSLGDIYYFKLLEKPNAQITYKKFLERFPDSEFVPDVLYKLYLINKDTDPAQAEVYANLLKTKYPQSSFAKILVNPNYLKESSLAEEKQKVIYKSAYAQFEAGDYGGATNFINEAAALGETSFTPNLQLLKILIIGRNEDINAYQYALEQFIKEHPDAEITPYAKKLLDASHNFQKTKEKEQGIQFVRSFEESHYFVLVYRQENKISGPVTALLEEFNNKSFSDLKLKTSSLILNDEYAIAMVTELPRLSYGLEYFKTFNEKQSGSAVLHDHKIYIFVITKDNFDIFYRTKGLDEYIKFFEKNYHIENQ